MTELIGYKFGTKEMKSETWMLTSYWWGLPNSPSIIVHGMIPQNSTIARTIMTTTLTQSPSI